MKQTDITFFAAALLLISGLCEAVEPVQVIDVQIAPGPCEPTWKSLGDNFKTPSWWRKAKIGMWLHWGPQSVGQDGDWYA
jgi:alpha-L-fucosidase